MDASGRAHARFAIPPARIPELIGLRAHHAFVTSGPNMNLAMASNAVTVSVVP